MRNNITAKLVLSVERGGWTTMAQFAETEVICSDLDPGEMAMVLSSPTFRDGLECSLMQLLADNRIEKFTDNVPRMVQDTIVSMLDGYTKHITEGRVSKTVTEVEKLREENTKLSETNAKLVCQLEGARKVSDDVYHAVTQMHPAPVILEHSRGNGD